MKIAIDAEWQNNRQGFAGVARDESGNILFITGATFCLDKEAENKNYYGWIATYLPSKDAIIDFTKQLMLNLAENIQKGG